MEHSPEVYPGRESKHLEFKSILPKFSALIKTCIAFANGCGGKIVIGVDDKTREVIGITDKERDRLYDDFLNSLYDTTSPTLLAQLYEKWFNEKSVFIIEIPPSPKKPYFLKREGIPKGVYLRVGSSTRRCSLDSVEDLIREGKRMTFDEEIIHQDIAILSQTIIAEFYGRQVPKKRLLMDKIIMLSSANTEKYYPTVAGTLLFSEEPESFLPEATVICTKFAGNEGRNIIQTHELTGPIGQLADRSFQLVSEWIKKNFIFKGMQLQGDIPIPKEALREAIINALIHRKYSTPGAIKIAVYDNHL